MRARVAATVSEPSPKAMSLRPASASSGNSNGVFAPSSRSCARVCSALPASPIRVAKATFVCSKSAAEVTAFIPAASATPPPASAAPSPTFNPAAVRLAIFLADAETSWVAPTMDRCNAEMSAPRVTVRALMRRGWSQPVKKSRPLRGEGCRSTPFTALPAFVPHLATPFRSLRSCWVLGTELRATRNPPSLPVIVGK